MSPECHNSRTDPSTPEPLVEIVKNPNPEVHGPALHILWQLNRDMVPRADLLPLLSSSHSEIVTIAWRLIEGTGHVQPGLPEPLASAREQEQKKGALTSAEAALLTTNQLATARLIGLKVLERNADAKAVDLALPLLRDSNPIVRSRAFAVLNAITGQDLSEDEPVKWERWWAVNQAGFTPRQVPIGTPNLPTR